MPINLSTSNVLARSFLFSRGSTGKLTETQWLNDSETDHEYIPGGCISASSLSTAPHGLGCGTSTHIIRFPWPFIDVHLWTQKRMSNALWQDPRWISFRDKIGKGSHGMLPFSVVRAKPCMNSTGHHRWRRDWLRKWLRTCDVCGRGKLQQRMVGVQCLYVSRLKEQAGKWHWPFAMWANCCRARRRRLQDDGGFPVNCGPVHMHAYGTADAMHKRCMNCWYFPVAMDSGLDLYACLRSFVGDSHATVVTACRSQDFRGCMQENDMR